MLLHWRPRRRRRRSQSSSALAKTRSGSALLIVSPDRGAMRQASTTCLPNWRRSGWNYCLSCCPVRFGLVDSLARPGGNATSFNYLSAELAAKRLELLLELMPGAKNLAVLVDPAVPPTQTTLREVTAAASTMGLRIKILNASNSSEINAAFATLARERPDVLFVGLGFLFIDRRVQLVHLATLHKLPTTYAHR